MTTKLYELLRADVEKWKPGYITTLLGEGTEFEAISRFVEDEDHQWMGFLIFRDARFSPLDADMPNHLQMKHELGTYSGGTYGDNMARLKWEEYCALFRALLNRPN